MPTSRGRTQDRKLVAGGQEHEVRCEAKKVAVKPSTVKTAVSKAGNSRNVLPGCCRNRFESNTTALDCDDDSIHDLFQ